MCVEAQALRKFQCCQVLKLLCWSLEELFAVFEQGETLKKAMVRNLWTVLRPYLSKGKFEKVTEHPWAQTSNWGLTG